MQKCFLLICSAVLIGGTVIGQDEIKVLTQSELEELKSQMPIEAETAYNEGIMAFQSKNYSLAVEKYTQAINSYNNFELAYFNRGLSNAALKKDDEAISDFKKANEINPSNHAALFETGVIYANKSDFENALKYFGDAITVNQDVKYLYKRSIILFQQKEYDKALDDLNKIIKSDPSFAYAYNDRGSVYKEQSKLDDAIADYKKAVTIDKSLKIAHNNLGTAYRKKGQYDLAIASYNAAIALDKNFYLAYNNRGYAKYEKGDYAGALADFDEVIRLKSDYVFAFNNKASVYLKQEKYNDAVKACDQAIKLNSEYGYAYYNRGIAYEMLRNDKQACSDWSKAAELGIDIADSYYSNNECYNF